MFKLPLKYLFVNANTARVTENVSPYAISLFREKLQKEEDHQSEWQRRFDLYRSLAPKEQRIRASGSHAHVFQ